MKPMVSVWMVTYNHGAFIEQALESVLMQERDFEIEIVIGEDCSKDNTREIIRRYEKQYPEIIKPIYHQQNVGATRNAYEFSLPACQGKYIAVLEGDDYWTDPGKLKKQVDFLEKNPDFSACGHQAVVFYEDGSASSYNFGEDKENVFELEDMISHRKFHTASLIFRGDVFREIERLPLTILSCDRAILAMLAAFGKIKYMKDPMCVYRKSSVGISSSITYKDLRRDLNMLPWLKRAKKDFPVMKLRSFIHLSIYTYGAKKIPFSVLLNHYIRFIFFSFSYFPKNLGNVKHGTIFFFKRLF